MHSVEAVTRHLSTQQHVHYDGAGCLDLIPSVANEARQDFDDGFLISSSMGEASIRPEWLAPSHCLRTDSTLPVLKDLNSLVNRSRLKSLLSSHQSSLLALPSFMLPDHPRPRDWIRHKKSFRPDHCIQVCSIVAMQSTSLVSDAGMAFKPELATQYSGDLVFHDLVVFSIFFITDLKT